ncbi:hypothetical protein NKJ95_32050 [Mesorhizobium sp. M0012]|uniref:hypothetical protein n=1 Tax=Mesorhizobium sp. M0012 TaxID=2956840 RepID=UPI00333700AB
MAPDLRAHEVEPLKEAVELGAGVVRQRRSLRRSDALQPVRRLAQAQPEAADAEAGEDRLDMVDNPGLLADQGPPLAVRPPRVLLFECRDRRHGAMAFLAAQPAEKSAHQKLGVETIGLGAAVLAHRNARGMDGIGLDAVRPQPARQPEAVAGRLVSDGDPLDRVPGPAGFVAPALQ